MLFSVAAIIIALLVVSAIVAAVYMYTDNRERERGRERKRKCTSPHFCFGTFLALPKKQTDSLVWQTLSSHVLAATIFHSFCKSKDLIYCFCCLFVAVGGKMSSVVCGLHVKIGPCRELAVEHV